MEFHERINIDGHRYGFICRSRATRSGFAHDCEMYDVENWETMSRATRYYLNRTWEGWTFQSVILDAIKNAASAEKERIELCTKAANGWARLTADRRAILEDAYEDSPVLDRLARMRDEVKGYHPAWEI